MERKLGINAHCLTIVSELDALQLIKDTGFDSVFLATYDQKGVRQIKAEADRLGLTIAFIHAPFDRINEMWMPGIGYLYIFCVLQILLHFLILFDNLEQKQRFHLH